MSTVTTDGITKAFEFLKPYTAFGSHIPALNGFYLQHITPPIHDHRVNYIQVLPGGHSQDLSPTNADLNPSNIPDGNVWVVLQDKDPKNEPFYYKVSHALLENPRIGRFQIRDVGCTGECIQPLPNFSAGPQGTLFPPLFALVGFEMFFIGGRDFQLERIGVWFDQGNDLHVALDDSTGKETFGYLVDFVVIPTFGMNVFKDTSHGSASAGGGDEFEITPPQGIDLQQMDFIIRGWQFKFTNGKHNIRDIGVFDLCEPRNGNNRKVQVCYGDKTENDPFEYSIDYGFISSKVGVNL
jgi:hypothetical protein